MTGLLLYNVVVEHRHTRLTNPRPEQIKQCACTYCTTNPNFKAYMHHPTKQMMMTLVTLLLLISAMVTALSFASCSSLPARKQKNTVTKDLSSNSACPTTTKQTQARDQTPAILGDCQEEVISNSAAKYGNDCDSK
jgi:hypothetical protein